MDISKTLEQILSERTIKLSDIPDLELSENSQAFDELQKLCERKKAYRLGVDGFIGYKYLWDLILNAIKMENSINNLMVDSHCISPNIVFKILNSLEGDGLIRKENSHYRAVLDKLLSKEVILGFCWARADMIKIKDILDHFGCHDNCDNFNYVGNIIRELCDEGKIQWTTIGGSFYWNDI